MPCRSTQKIVLVRPQGGLNDAMSQIEKCCRYAEKSRRVVVVDTAYARSETFHDDLSEYFVSLQPGLILDARTFDFDKEQDVFPPSLARRLNAYFPGDRAWREPYKVADSDDWITFDFDKDYAEKVLIHHQAGRGGGEKIFQRMRLSACLQNSLLERLKKLGSEYIGVHVRNTDYESDFQSFFDIISKKRMLAGKVVFLATDSQDVLEEFQRKIRETAYFDHTNAALLGSAPIHTRKFQSREFYKKENFEAILDLFTLAYSKTILASHVIAREGQPREPFLSGFTELAMRLQEDRAMLTRSAGIPGWLDVV